MDRRAFLAASSAGAIAVAVGGNLVIGGNGAWAMSTKALTGDEAAMLVRMARATYPHAMLDDAIYGKVVYSLDEKAAADPALLRSLQEGAATLKSKKFDTLDEAGQEAVLKQIETSAPFQAVRGECVTGIYNNPDVWKVLGYEGPSAELGGYINRGFSDIDWLQDA
ncbi:MAG: Twin-arginine translocation pathway signal [Rhodospirillum sp.]|nr:Twin-arginine translocation pathway signal [Rhodospirillum sp.]